MWLLRTVPLQPVPDLCSRLPEHASHCPCVSGQPRVLMPEPLLSRSPCFSALRGLGRAAVNPPCLLKLRTRRAHGRRALDGPFHGAPSTGRGQALERAMGSPCYRSHVDKCADRLRFLASSLTTRLEAKPSPVLIWASINSFP